MLMTVKESSIPVSPSKTTVANSVQLQFLLLGKFIQASTSAS